ncbi:hypothetical protein CDCA_CDCA13G3666 [Cyanidium caldarium]|uniref:Peptidase M3A/M3B catalytic domain-containing protein n=1 Tax=Cyanidium caldarium TaxID=2771 RepID=A0AAV9J026_CYACA|nr:hypothetical protein CDCA_CDCA13G3666 [Cyanidium caldarium]
MRGLFGLERLVQPQDWFRLGEHAVRRCEQIAQGILQRTSGRLLYEFDTLSDTLCQVLDAAELASELSPDPHHVEASMAVAKQLNEYMQSLNGNTALFEALIAGAEPRTAEEHEMVRSLARDFALRGGVQATAAQRRRIQELQQRIEMSEREVLRQAQRVRPPDPDTPHRPAGDTAVVRCLSTLLAQRQQLAGVLGYRSYADLALADRLIGSPENAWRLLNVLRKAFTMAEHGGNILQLMRRDMRVDRSEMLNEPRSFLALPQVLAGLQRLTRHLFGIALTPVRERDEAATAVWHPAVRAYRLVDVERGEQPVGELYLDLHERDGKREQAAHYALRGGRQLYDGTYQLPSAVVVCDFEAEVDTDGLSYHQLQTLLHEYGHALHTLLSRTQFQHLSGTRVALDFAEVPSHLMEYFARDVQWLKCLAPNASWIMRKCLVEGHAKMARPEAQELLAVSAVDLALHNHLPPAAEAVGGHPDVAAVIDAARSAYDIENNLPNELLLSRLSHLVGYGSSHYSYLVAEVIAAEIWQAHFHQRHHRIRDAGERLRREVLAYGGARSPRHLVRSILDDREPSVNCWLRELRATVPDDPVPLLLPGDGGTDGDCAHVL